MSSYIPHRMEIYLVPHIIQSPTNILKLLHVVASLAYIQFSDDLTGTLQDTCIYSRQHIYIIILGRRKTKQFILMLYKTSITLCACDDG